MLFESNLWKEWGVKKKKKLQSKKQKTAQGYDLLFRILRKKKMILYINAIEMLTINRVYVVPVDIIGQLKLIVHAI